MEALFALETIKAFRIGIIFYECLSERRDNFVCEVVFECR